MVSGAEFEPTEWIVDRFAQANFNAPDRLGDCFKPTEIDHHEVINRHTGHVLDGLKCAARTATEHGFVEFPSTTTDAFAVGVLARG